MYDAVWISSNRERITIICLIEKKIKPRRRKIAHNVNFMLHWIIMISSILVFMFLCQIWHKLCNLWKIFDLQSSINGFFWLIWNNDFWLYHCLNRSNCIIYYSVVAWYQLKLGNSRLSRKWSWNELFRIF